jgi:hypothetical protein
MPGGVVAQHVGDEGVGQVGRRFRVTSAERLERGVAGRPFIGRIGGLPLGLAHDAKVLRPVRKGQSLVRDDVAVDTSTQAWRIRQAMEQAFSCR